MVATVIPSQPLTSCQEEMLANFLNGQTEWKFFTLHRFYYISIWIDLSVLVRIFVCVIPDLFRFSFISHLCAYVNKMRKYRTAKKAEAKSRKAIKAGGQKGANMENKERPLPRPLQFRGSKMAEVLKIAEVPPNKVNFQPSVKLFPYASLFVLLRLLNSFVFRNTSLILSTHASKTVNLVRR